MGERGRRLAQQAAALSEKLDLPAALAPNVPRMELAGNRSFYMDRHRGVLSYSTEAVDIHGGGVIVRLRGRELQLQVMTEEELRISGVIEQVELVE